MGSPTLLLVEDIEDVRELLKQACEKMGLRVISAESEEDAVRVARRSPPDLILLELGLPPLKMVDIGHRIRIGAAAERRTSARRRLGRPIGRDGRRGRGGGRRVQHLHHVAGRRRPSTEVPAPTRLRRRSHFRRGECGVTGRQLLKDLCHLVTPR